MKIGFILFMMLLLFKEAPCRQVVQKDTSIVELRSFNNAQLNQLKKQKAFQYNRLKEPPVSWWNKLLNWFWWKVTDMMKTPQGKTTIWGVLIAFGIATIAFFVLKVSGMSKGSIFERGHSRLQYVTAAEDINQIAFDEAINTAIHEGNYRQATRLLYLQALKKLSDNGFIKWQLNKTNTDYLNELTQKPWYDEFKQLTLNFEYTWYGEAFISQPVFNKLHHQFQHFNNMLK